MTLSEELQWRGQIKDKTFDDITYLDTPKSFYLGADCSSSDSLTIGNLAIYMLARRLLKHGWKAIMLVGGATSLIGDPGGKEEERTLKSIEEINHNVTGIQAQVERLVDGMDFATVNNYDWFKDVGYLQFLRDVGKHYSMTELLQRDFIASRIGEGGSGISYAEFSYSLIQGYDYWQLFKEHHVELQIGGSDQWGNMLSGVPLIRKKENAEVHALSIPLVINAATGKKFGKSEDGAVWLDADKTSVYQFYQFWLNLDDESIEEYLKIYTELSKDDVDATMKIFTEDPSQRHAQKTLAYEVTKLVHGQENADAVVFVTDLLFGSKVAREVSPTEVAVLTGELEVVEESDGTTVIDCLAASGLAGSNGEARRLLAQGAVKVNGYKQEENSVITTSQAILQGHALLQRGKNKFALIAIK